MRLDGIAEAFCLHILAEVNENTEVAEGAFCRGIAALLAEEYSVAEDAFGVKCRGFDFSLMLPEAKQDLADAQTMLAEEKDEELRDLAKEEAADAKARIAGLEQELKILLLPKDPNDEKNVIVEIRAGAGGEEAARRGADLRGL